MTVRIYFDSNGDEAAFLSMCRTIARVMEETKRMKAMKCHQ